MGDAGEQREYVLGQELKVTILTTGAETDGRHDLVEVVQPPGSMTPLHLHTRYEERIWVLEGELTVWVAEEKVTAGPGGFFVIPTNVPHAVQAGPAGARALTISSPAGFAELIARSGTPAHLAGPDTEVDAELFAAVAAELGDVLLGPPGSTPADLP
jgi:quercetin dioxygenase-like cupin family protein